MGRWSNGGEVDLARKADFSADEWEIVAGLPSMVVAAASISDGAPLIGTLREMGAGIQAIKDGAVSYAGVPLIEDILREFLDDDTAEHAGPHQPPEDTSERLDEESFVLEAVTTAERARSILAEKATPDEAAMYSDWVLAIVTAVIERAKSGGFLGIGGERVDQAEARFRDALAAALRG